VVRSHNRKAMTAAQISHWKSKRELNCAYTAPRARRVYEPGT